MSGPRDLVFCGPMAAGKTTVARIVADNLGWRFDDLDVCVEAREGRTVAQLFAEGEERFRAAEVEAARAWLARPEDAPGVLALGGGTLQHEGLAEELRRRAIVVHLDAPAVSLARRLRPEDVRVRPLLSGEGNLLQALAELRESRAAGYARSHVRIQTADKPRGEVALELLRLLYDPETGEFREPARPIAAPDDEDELRGAAAGVTIGRGALPFPPTRAAALLIDRNLPAAQTRRVLELLAARAGALLARLEREGGEGAKTAESLLAAWRELLEAGLDRDTPLWIVGGGSLSDLGGFIAATYKRGVPFALLPTTLLAQLDAALGGKNGINLDRTKNAVGAVRLPDAVHLDPLFLLSLPESEFRGGMAEAVKTAVVGDGALLEIIEARAAALAARPLPDLEEIVRRAARVKLAFVGRDIEDRGARRALNLGHTLGHALEAATARRARPLSHGEAVAVGAAFAARLAQRIGLLEARDLPERLDALFAALGLPSRPPALDAEEEAAAERALARDKKRFGGENVWVLPVAPGRVAFRVAAREEFEATWKEFRCARS